MEQTVTQSQDGGESSEEKKSFQDSIPKISLPKGGGAIQGMGEKFAANPVTGTGSFTIPIATSPGRAGFGPELSLAYDSGSGNSPFGFGWSLSLPEITRKTSKGLPKYRDNEASDVFLLSGAEDLVPFLKPDGKCFEDNDSDPDYIIHRYRPRIEGLFARIERWTRKADNDVHWRSISKDNILTIHGKDSQSRIYHPDDPERIFTWLISETRDDKGNAILYEYKAEDGKGLDLSQVQERNRGGRADPKRSTNRYIKRIHYGNQTTLLENGKRPRFLKPDKITQTHWMFEVVFDYGEHQQNTPEEQTTWQARPDPFSNYRAGFEIRTNRLCKRTLMFHHFPDEQIEGVTATNYLVKSTNFDHANQQPSPNQQKTTFSYITSVTQTSYKDDQERSLPPLEFTYTQPEISQQIQTVDKQSLENIPTGNDGGTYQWIDLDGEGLSGLLTQQATGWYYKRNLSPINITTDQPNGTPPENDSRPHITPKFAAIESISKQPATVALASHRLMDIDGDGRLEAVAFDTNTPGYQTRTADADWEPLTPFSHLPTINWKSPHLKFIDITGDGHADILISEDEVFCWYPSLAKSGFGPRETVRKTLDEETSPRIVFADQTQSIYLSDMSGDGLTDILRIRNGDICYWPNLGYGRFGAKVTMDNAPRFDYSDQFSQQRIRLADIDGSGVIDIIYLSRKGVQIYFNQSGNSWSKAHTLPHFPAVDNLSSVNVIDLLGNGTACLVWSSPLPGTQQKQMRYIDLMGGQKPHLLVKVNNNLGAETEIHYAPSTRFYLQDKLAGTPWITRIAFPVHVVEKVTVTDKWRKTTFSSTYSYHHGYFDGVEREFRGFGRVEQLDTENYGTFEQGNSTSPYITDDKTLYQPPVKTITWFHTGAYLERDKILNQFEQEYFPNHLDPDHPLADSEFRENPLPQPDLSEENLDTQEWREALRACKGMTLRQEVYELDVDALEQGQHLPVKLFTTAYHNCHINVLQRQQDNKHAVFHVTESEAITYNYELDLTQKANSTITRPDPRIAHTLNLNIDEYGNILQSVAVVYPRLIINNKDDSLSDGAKKLIHQVQQKTHLAYTENRFTNDVASDPDNYRLKLPAEVLTYELTGINPAPANNNYFSLQQLRNIRLSDVHQSTGSDIESIPYHQSPASQRPQKRIIEHVQMRYFAEDLQTALDVGKLNSLALPYETYTLAMTNDLLATILDSKFTQTVQQDLKNEKLSGYQYHPDTGQYWIRSGIAGFANDATEHFYLPERYIDPFDNITTLEFDDKDLFITSSTDPVGNTVKLIHFDYRVLQPSEIQDINGNTSQTTFDVIGLAAASAIKGKNGEGDHLENVTAEVPPEITATFFSETFDPDIAADLLGSATARHIYDFGETKDIEGNITYGQRPASAAAIVREQHLSALQPGQASPVQVAFEYSDGGGNVLVKKVQAEPDPATLNDPTIIPQRRWIASGKTILNNKGKPVKQYEPYFSVDESGQPNHRYEEPQELGVTPVIYYDAAGRDIRTELPDDTFTKVDFTPWEVIRYDANDTVLESKWFKDRAKNTAADWLTEEMPRDLQGKITLTAEQRAAWLSAQHASTPTQVFLDSLGRDVISIEHNITRYTRPGEKNNIIEEKYLTYTKLDAEGKPLWIQDARGNRVMEYLIEKEDITSGETTTYPCYDIAGNLLFQHSMDAGDRWMINDAAGQPFYAWDINDRANPDGSGNRSTENRIYHSSYDPLRRPLEQQLQILHDSWEFTTSAWQTIEKLTYGESQPNSESCNLRGQLYQQYDPSGLITHACFDFKGNELQTTRRLTREAKTE
ncbi:MAG TPA: toxin, partial [Gammaproteobacteria bacterium]|nr:toxin [Gammaproteobacteria bacterium]